MPAAVYTTDELEAAQQLLCDRVMTGTVNTTGTTPAVILTVPTLANTNHQLHVYLCARRTDGSSGSWSRLRTVSARDVSGVVTIDGTTIVSTDGSGLASGVTAGSSSVILTVTGSLLQSWTWKCRVLVNRI